MRVALAASKKKSCMPLIEENHVKEVKVVPKEKLHEESDQNQNDEYAAKMMQAKFDKEDREE